MAAFPTNSPALTAGEPTYGSSVPKATGGKVQPRSPHGPKLKTKKVTVKSHVRKVTVKQAPKSNGGTPAAPVNPDQALIDAAVRSRFAPQEQALNEQLGANSRYTSGLGDWYSNAMDEIRGLQTAGQARAQQTLGAITAYNSPATLANPADQQAANARNNLNAEFAGMIGGNATANSGALDRINAALAIQQGNQRNAANVDRTHMLSNQGALGQQKADYGLQYGAQLSAAEAKAANDQAKLTVAQNHENAYEGIAKNAGLLKEKTLNQVQIPLAKSLTQSRKDAAAVARSNARSKKAADQASRQAKSEANSLSRAQFMAKYGISPDQAQKMTPGQWSHYAKQNANLPGFGGNGKGSKGKTTGRYTQTQLNHYDNQWHGARALAGHLKAAGQYNAGTKAKPVMKPITRDVVYSALLKEYKDDPEFAAAAADIAFGVSVNQHDLHVLATKGVHPTSSTSNVDKVLGKASPKVRKYVNAGVKKAGG